MANQPNPRPQDDRKVPPQHVREDDDTLEPTPVDRAKDTRGGLSTGIDTGAIQPGKTGDART